MEQKKTNQQGAETRLPWSPLSVSLIAFLLPPGGLALTVWNLRRLQVLDGKMARQLTIAVTVICVVGLTLLTALSPPGPNGSPQPSAEAAGVLSIGVAFASYAVQRNPFGAWRLSHLSMRTSSWLAALGLAALYSLPVYLVIGLLYEGGRRVQM